MKVYDYIVIGAGPAGCFSAALLAEKGYSVCVLEKGSEGSRKVCGDGISARATEVLKQVGFPVEKFISAGAVQIDSSYEIRGDVQKCYRLKENGRLAFAVSRQETDSLFRQWCSAHGVDIFFNTCASKIKRCDVGFSVCGYYSANLVIAVGAGGNVFLDGEKLIPAFDRPVGVSMVVSGKKPDENFFLFEYKAEYRGTYSWIFTLSNDTYNIGTWLKEDKKSLTKMFTAFCSGRAAEVCGSYEIIVPARYAVKGIGETVEKNYPGVYILGDAANTSSTFNGEGISRAIISAVEFAERI